jgi:hypothetical protein
VSSPSLQAQAYEADCAERFVDAGNLYWRSFDAGEPFDLPTTLRAVFIFFESTDPGVGPGNGLSNEDMDTARQRFHVMLDHLKALGHDDDAEVWRNWIGQLGMDWEYELPSGAIEQFALRGSREAAWRLAANGDRSGTVMDLASSLRAELAGETTFRAAYILNMLRELPVN